MYIKALLIKMKHWLDEEDKDPSLEGPPAQTSICFIRQLLSMAGHQLCKADARPNMLRKATVHLWGFAGGLAAQKFEIGTPENLYTAVRRAV